MSQSRYFSAFLISTLVFFVLYFILLSLSDIKKIAKPAASKVIKIALITPIKKIVKPVAKATPPVIVKKIVKKKVIKKVKPKKVVKKKIVKKKIIKKKIKPKKVLKKKIVKKRIIKKPVKTYMPIAPPVYVAPKPVLKPVLKPTRVATPQPKVKNNYHKKAFLRNVRSKIIANKKYPKIAKRRHIEGSVKVRFDITKRGHMTNIRFINGKRVFYKSIRKTLERTFPMGIPSEVKSELPISDVSVVLHFNIR